MEKEFEAIFREVCGDNRIKFRRDVFDYLMKKYYVRLGAKPNACHPRDIIDHIVDHAPSHIGEDRYRMEELLR